MPGMAGSTQSLNSTAGQQGGWVGFSMPGNMVTQAGASTATSMATQGGATFTGPNYQPTYNFPVSFGAPSDNLERINVHVTFIEVDHCLNEWQITSYVDIIMIGVTLLSSGLGSSYVHASEHMKCVKYSIHIYVFNAILFAFT